MADGFLSVSRRIEAPAEQLFALLADSANHSLMGDYLADRRLVWAPMTPTSDPEEQHAVDPVRYEWGYELVRDGPGATVVTETFDCRRAPQDLREMLREGETWRDAMAASLVKLELLATPQGQQ